MNLDLYSILGLDVGVTVDAVKRAYRKKAAAAHPDAGGDPAAFRNLVLARDVLSDEKKRTRYDATGLVDGDDEDRERIATLDLIFQLTCEVLAKTPGADLVEAIRQMLRDSLTSAAGRIDTIDVATKRIKSRWKGAKAARATILSGLDQTRMEIQKRMKLYDRGLVELKDASFQTDAAREADELIRLFKSRHPLL